MTEQIVRITVTDGMGRKEVREDVVVPTERTPGIAAQDLISSVCLRDGDTIEVHFFTREQCRYCGKFSADPYHEEDCSFGPAPGETLGEFSNGERTC